MKRALAGVIFSTGLVACQAQIADDAGPCRPTHIAPATLGIGPLTFQPSEIDAGVIIGASGRSALSVKLDEAGTIALADLTRANVGSPLDLAIGGEVKISPIVQEAITGGELQVTGYLSTESVEADVLRLRPACPVVKD